jgi:hypothetical protein
VASRTRIWNWFAPAVVPPMMNDSPMSPFIGAFCHVPPCMNSTPWMPLARWETEMAAHQTCALCRKPMLMSPE